MIAKIITAPEPFVKSGAYSVFLAGAIDMGAAVDWQAYVMDCLRSFDITIVNPRRPHFDETTLDPQILWELQALRDVNVVFMWFPKDAKAPISFLESGLYMQSSKILIGAETGFYRRRNLELTTEFYGVKLYSSLVDMIRTLGMAKWANLYRVGLL